MTKVCAHKRAQPFAQETQLNVEAETQVYAMMLTVTHITLYLTFKLDMSHDFETVCEQSVAPLSLYHHVYTSYKHGDS